MLVLTRKVGDVIAIGDNIKIVVLSIKGGQIRIGIEADKNTVIHREEIYQKIKQETSAASLANPQMANQASHLLEEPNLKQNKKTLVIRRKSTDQS